MSRKDVIEQVLLSNYRRMGGAMLCDYMAKYIDEHWEKWQNDSWSTLNDEIRNYIWMNTSGGGVAQDSADRIEAAVATIEEN